MKVTGHAIYKGRDCFFLFSSKVSPRELIFGVPSASRFDGGTLNFLTKGDKRSASQDRADFVDIESDP